MLVDIYRLYICLSAHIYRVYIYVCVYITIYTHTGGEGGSYMNNRYEYGVGVSISI